MMRYFISLLLPVMVQGQSIEEYVHTHTSVIHTIDPDQTNYADLLPIGKAIGDARVVFLGEQDHGDAPTFLAKTRLIKYLHEQMGFDVLAFESDFYGLTEGWDRLVEKPDSITSFIKGNIFGVWTMCNTCQPLLSHYIPDQFKSGKPLILTGFDCQMVLTYSYLNLYRTWDTVLRKYALPTCQQPDYNAVILPLITNMYRPAGKQPDSNLYNRRHQYLLKIKEELSARSSPDDFWVQVTDNLITTNLRLKYKNDYWKDGNLRDEQMAKNLRWLCEKKFPGKKIIVWAANYHISKHNGHYPEDFLNNAQTMGACFTQDSSWARQTYVLGFTSYKGEAGRMLQPKYKVPAPAKKSFENWIDPSFNNSFTDFKAYNLANPVKEDVFYMSGSIKGNGHHIHHKAAWNQVFDGVFFIRDMYPCK